MRELSLSKTLTLNNRMDLVAFLLLYANQLGVKNVSLK